MSLPRLMKAAVLHKIRSPLIIEQVPVPQIAENEVLVKTESCGLCGTDLHIYDGWGYTPELPFIMGHEPAGNVVSVGANVSDFKVGDRVVPNIFYSCGSCFYCRNGRETTCSNWQGTLGVINHFGAYAEYFKVPAKQIFKLPETIPFDEGSVIADAVVTAIRSIKKARVNIWDNIMVVSIGGIGASIVQICKMLGATVNVVVRSQTKHDRAMEMGADKAFILVNENETIEQLKKSEHMGVDCVFDCVGSEDTLRLSVNSLAAGGRLVIVGYTQEKYPLDPRIVAVKELEIIGSRSGVKQDTVDAINIVARDNWKPIVSDSFPLDNVNDALHCLREGKALGRIVLTFGK